MTPGPLHHSAVLPLAFCSSLNLAALVSRFSRSSTKGRPRPHFYCPGSYVPCSVRTQIMAANTASTLIKFLLEPAPLEHLLLDITSEEHCRIRQRELTAILDACCTQLEHDGPPHPEAGDQQLLINVELADQLRESLGPAIMGYKSDSSGSRGAWLGHEPSNTQRALTSFFCPTTHTKLPVSSTSRPEHSLPSNSLALSDRPCGYLVSAIGAARTDSLTLHRTC